MSAFFALFAVFVVLVIAVSLSTAAMIAGPYLPSAADAAQLIQSVGILMAGYGAWTYASWRISSD